MYINPFQSANVKAAIAASYLTRTRGAPFGAPLTRDENDSPPMPYSLVGMRWCDDIRTYFRENRLAHKELRRAPEGYYVDAVHQDEITQGVIVRLTGKDGQPRWYAGFTDPFIAGMACIDLGGFCTEITGAARAADRLAELYGEWCREDSLKFHVAQEQEMLRETIIDCRAKHHTLVKELHTVAIAASKAGVTAPKACEVIRAQLRSYRAEMTAARKRILALDESPWLVAQ